MKGKIIMFITIGIICILLTSVMFVQFKTVQVIEESGISAMTESELRDEYSTIKSKTEELAKSLEEVNSSIKEYENQSSNNKGTTDLLKEDIQKAKNDIGYTDVKGPGLIITIKDGDGEYEKVEYWDLLFALNELKYAGAEAISINDSRIVNNTYIKSIEDNYLVIDGPRKISPYVIKVIGDTKYLESVINIKGGLKDEMENTGKSISYTVEDEVSIPKYKGKIEINSGE